MASKSIWAWRRDRQEKAEKRRSGTRSEDKGEETRRTSRTQFEAMFEGEACAANRQGGPQKSILRRGWVKARAAHRLWRARQQA